MPSVTAAMNATPDDRPSSPSIQLMLLIIPTIQKTVSPAATTPVPANEIGRPPNGLATKSIVMPERHRAAGQEDLAQELVAGAEVEQVVDGAQTGGHGTAEQERRRLGRREGERHRHDPAAVVDEEEGGRHGEERGAHREPAATRHGDRVHPSGLGPVDDLVAQHDPADQGSQGQGEHGRRDEREEDRSQVVADFGDEGHRRPGRLVTASSVRPLTRSAGRAPGTGSRSRGPRRPGEPRPPARRGRGSPR